MKLSIVATAAACLLQLSVFGAEYRRPTNEADLRKWLENMVWYHHFSIEEIQAATGMRASDLKTVLLKSRIRAGTRPKRDPEAPLLVLPYPGGRHPRIGFLEGAIDPQRETKLSVFAPWNESNYVVMDVPEAIWSNLGLTYLAHTHIPTIWTKQKIDLPKLEWKQLENGDFRMERTLPNGIRFGTHARPQKDAVLMKMWLYNGTQESLSDLRVQNCVMLKGARGFQSQTNTNKIFRSPWAVARSEEAKHWVISGWTPCHRPWGNARVPCLHSDPKFPDTLPGQTNYLRGWLSFFIGADIEGELKRIDESEWEARIDF